MPDLGAPYHLGGHAGLRQALAVHLSGPSGLVTRADQLLITAGSGAALTLLLGMLASPGDAVLLPGPSEPALRAALALQGLRLLDRPTSQPVCFEIVRASESPASKPPTGRWRIELCDEFLPRLPDPRVLNGSQHTIRCGDLSTLLHPEPGIAYLAVPELLAPALRQALAASGHEAQGVQQLALARLIADGHLCAHLGRLRPLYARRRQHLIRALRDCIGSDLQILSCGALSLACELPSHVDDQALSRQANSIGLRVQALSRWHAHPAAAPRGLVLGYACDREDEQQRAVQALARVLRPVLGLSAPTLARMRRSAAVVAEPEPVRERLSHPQ
jgi:GntR family transcriptional regulator/MocR family aminotransferase